MCARPLPTPSPSTLRPSRFLTALLAGRVSGSDTPSLCTPLLVQREVDRASAHLALAWKTSVLRPSSSVTELADLATTSPTSSPSGSPPSTTERSSRCLRRQHSRRASTELASVDAKCASRTPESKLNFAFIRFFSLSHIIPLSCLFFRFLALHTYCHDPMHATSAFRALGSQSCPSNSILDRIINSRDTKLLVIRTVLFFL